MDVDGRDLWFAADVDLSDRADAALVALLIPAMHAGEDVQVDGPVTDTLLRSLPAVQAVLTAVLRSLMAVDVKVAEERPATTKVQGVATGFSAGIDSFTAVAEHDPTTLLFNNVGSHGPAGRLFRPRFERAARVDLGLPFVAVDSNLDDFYDDLSFQRTHTMRNAAVAHVLHPSVGTWLYASGLPYTAVKVAPAHDLAYVDPILLPLLSTPAIELRSVGGEHTRVTKTMLVAEMPPSWEALDVCVNSPDGGNCSGCWKCLRTLLTLDVGGVLDRYEPVFDLDVYRRHRADYLDTVAASSDPLLAEIRGFAAERGYPLPNPTWARIGRKVRRGVSRLRSR